MAFALRPRVDSDVPALVEVLGAQQPTSGYPHRWPLPFPVADFIVRDDQDRAWVVEVDGRVAGHVAVGPVTGEEATAFLHAIGTDDASALALVAVLFVDPSVKGRGVGGALLDAAVEWARSQGRLPVLDVLQGAAVDVYRHRGWQVIGELRPDWLPDAVPPMLLMSLPHQQ
ncbi:GNAT family N-acetyltransferase [Nocardioides sp. Soil796]|uniref:GNAT family N-acetyltransferase n=1 Tax=Nocardioides sp. Soil796 TaxID=1736412 RepID=UPI00070F4B97|nr:GNAT family N-acetyltransferase [Nocardioides sp. Soil796]KRF12543.1 hypothetical protein ASH02_13305 [Nocardioides sp. Soil796]